MGITRSYDPKVLEEGLLLCPQPIDCEAWLANTKNIMLRDEDNNVGLATYEYPGVYNLHWFFKVRGREALSLAHEMLAKFFEDSDAKLIRGLTPTHIKGARWLARQVGLTSQGILEFSNGPYEMFTLTRADYLKNRNK